MKEPGYSMMLMATYGTLEQKETRRQEHTQWREQKICQV